MWILRMKRIVILLFAVVAALSAYSQDYLQDGDRCFDSGDYACAITNHNEAFKLASGKDKQIAEIKLTRAKFCQEHIKLANTAFTNKQYSTAKTEYQTVLESNPKDTYAQSQLEKCNNALKPPPALRKATTAELTDIWNNKYGINPERRQRLIDAGIDPDDAQKRINSGEGKPAIEKPVNQAGAVTNTTKQSNYSQNNSQTNSTKTDKTKTKKCFNCPKNNEIWGITLSYLKPNAYNSKLHEVQFGLKVEPLFKYGFGLNTGLNVGFCFGKINDNSYTDYYYDDYHNWNNKDYFINIPLHLEYRLNFSKWFNMFFYGGAGFNAATTTDFDTYSLPVTFEYGGGFRINIFQLRAGRSLYLGDFLDIKNFGKNIKPYHNFAVSLDILF